MKTKRILRLILAISLFALSTMVVSCGKENSLSLTGPDKPDKKSTFVDYCGNESYDEVVASIADVEQVTGHKFSSEEKEKMLKDYILFTEEKNNLKSSSFLTALSRSAYTGHYVWSGHDTDLWLEYKWYAGSWRPYYFETPIWALYWAIRVCYGGQILNWSWMEGPYQRVTAVVGKCVYVPFGTSFVCAYLRVVS